MVRKHGASCSTYIACMHRSSKVCFVCSRTVRTNPRVTGSYIAEDLWASADLGRELPSRLRLHRHHGFDPAPRQNTISCWQETTCTEYSALRARRAFLLRLVPMIHCF